MESTVAHRFKFAVHDSRAFCIRLLLLVVVSLLLARHQNDALQAAFRPMLWWCNALPALLFALLIYGFCGRLALSVVVSTALVALVYKINAIKLRNLNAPLTPGDLVLGHQVGSNIGFFAHYTGYHATMLVLAPVLLVAIVVVLWRLETPRYHPSAPTRVALVVVSLSTFYALLHGARPWRGLYSDKVLTTYQQWNPAYSARSLGVMAAFVRMYQDMQISTPPPDRRLVGSYASRHAQELHQRESRALPAELPDIVVVQSEAFFDPGVLKHVDYGQYDPNYQRLAVTGISGSLTTPTYGGGTIRTEFETLTGYPMGAFPAVQYPYFGLAAGWMPSVPHRLQRFGYRTTLFHPFEGQFWNRLQVMPQLGFEHTHFEDAFKDAARAGLYVSDRALFDHVLTHLDHDAGGPSYTMVITMENHGAWDRDPGELADALRTHRLPPGLSPAGRTEMTYYVSHLINGDEALANFTHKLLARPRPTILLFYGDHLPALNAAYDDLGFDDGKTAPEEHTRYMLLSNRLLRSDQRRQLNLAAYDLPGLLFDTVGLPEDGYQALASTIRHERLQPDHDGGLDYTRLQINAALMEVNCGHKLDLHEHCQR